MGNRLTLTIALSHNKLRFLSYCHLHRKDTVFIAFRVPGWSWHIQQNQFGFMGLVNYDFIELHCCVHTSHIGLVPGGEEVRELRQEESQL